MYACHFTSKWHVNHFLIQFGCKSTQGKWIFNANGAYVTLKFIWNLWLYVLYKRIPQWLEFTSNGVMREIVLWLFLNTISKSMWWWVWNTITMWQFAMLSAVDIPEIWIIALIMEEIFSINVTTDFSLYLRAQIWIIKFMCSVCAVESVYTKQKFMNG